MMNRPSRIVCGVASALMVAALFAFTPTQVIAQTATASAQNAKQCESTRKACQNNCEREFRKDASKKASCTKDTCGVQYQACLNKAGSNQPAGTEKTTTDTKPRAPKAPAKDKMN